MVLNKKLLYPGETIVEGGGIPALTKFTKGNPGEALAVFIPGAGHNARISYGGHENSKKEDFLEHWLVAQGYHFLGVSYPLQTTQAIYDEAYPDFSIRAWGRQVAEIAQKVIGENKLSKRIILIVWSNGGRITQSFHEAATELGLEVDFCAAFSSTPPILFVTRPRPEVISHVKMDMHGYEDRSRSFESWYKDIAFNNAHQGREIIPKEIYLHEYVGNMPINIQGCGLRYHNRSFVPDEGEFLDDSKNYDFANYPLVAAIVTDNAIDGRHALTDHALWGVCNVNKIYSYIEKNRIDLAKLPPDRWKALVDLIHAVPRMLSAGTNGNHFFFVGEAGARKAAEDLKTLEQKVKSFKTSLGEMVGVAIK